MLVLRLYNNSLFESTLTSTSFFNANVASRKYFGIIIVEIITLFILTANILHYIFFVFLNTFIVAHLFFFEHIKQRIVE